MRNMYIHVHVHVCIADALSKRRKWNQDAAHKASSLTLHISWFSERAHFESSCIESESLKDHSSAAHHPSPLDPPLIIP